MTITQFILLVALFNFALSFYVLKINYKSSLNRWFALCSFLLGVWVFQNYLFQQSNSILILRSIYSLAPFIIITGLVWISYFKNKKVSRSLLFFNIAQFVINIVFAYLLMSSDQMIISVINYGDYQTGPWFIFFTTYIITLFVIFVTYAGVQYRNSVPEIRKKFRLIFLGILIMVFVSALVGFILPALGNSGYNMLDSPSSIFFVMLGAYSIINDKFLDIRSAATEIIAYFLVIIMFVFLFIIGEEAGFDLKVILFIILILASYLLVRSVRKEIEGREKNEQLAKHLEKDKIELKELDRMKDEFLQMATHELNTPITVIKGKLDMAIREDLCKLTPEQRKFLEPVLNDTLRLSTLSDDILNVARIDQHRLKINLSETAISELIAQIVSGFELKAKERGNSLLYIKPIKLLPKIKIDQVKIGEVITNLINNANKFTENGKITVTSKLTDDNIIISIADTGVGIEKEDQERLFEKFYQASRFDPENPQEQQGTGLGLYISKNIISLHGGKIWLDSEKGRGSTFYFSLPLKITNIANKLKEGDK